MNPERWEEIEPIFHAALALEPEARAALLKESCGTDASLRQAIESLLAHHDRSESFIETPASAAGRALDDEENESLAGQTIGHYQIIDRLGAGGMGEVYLARDEKLGRKAALKFLPRLYTKDKDRLQRFVLEARATSALNHPNIITIFEIGEANELHFIATEFIEGETLRDYLKRKLTTVEALAVAIQAAAALTAAHQAGIIHRDIKPENIMLRPDGVVKVLDFGIAKLTETITPQSVDTNAPTMPRAAQTASGVVVGTAQYMSPEQAAARKVDARSDIFSFGVVLYEMVTGQHAFAGHSLMETVAAILNEEPRPLPAKVPVELAKVILRCLRKEPARRYQTMADLKVALEDLREETIGTSSQPRGQARRRWAWAIWPALLMVVVLVGLFVWQPWRMKLSPQPLQSMALTTLPGVERCPSLSPDGNYVVFAWNGSKQDNQDIYVQQIGSGSPFRRTTDLLDDYNPVWSPDGRWIAFLRSQPTAPTGPRSRQLLLLPPLEGPERKLADIRSQDFPDAVYLAWSMDSNALLVTDSSGEGKPDALFVVSVETGEKRPLTNPQAPVLADTSPAVSPNGSSLVFLRRATWGAGELQLLPLGKSLTAAGEPRRITSIQMRADYPAWSDDGNEIIFSAKGSLWRLAITGDHTPTRIPYVGDDGLMASISRAQPGRPARLVYVRSANDSNFWRIETSAPGAPSTSAPALAISSTKWEYHCQFSPDGHRVAFSSLRSGDAEIWLSDPDGSNAVQLTNMQAQDSNCPHWSPNGQLIAFSSNAEGEWDVYVVPATGGKPRRLTAHPAIDLCPSFSRDGQWIYFSSTRSGDSRIWKMHTAGGDAVPVTNYQTGLALEGPDGGSLYYNETSVVSPFWRVPTSGGEPVKILEGVVWFNWCLLEKGAYYIDRFEGETRLQYLNFESGKSTVVARNLGEVSAGLTATPDGRTILYTRIDSSTDDLMMVENFR